MTTAISAARPLAEGTRAVAAAVARIASIAEEAPASRLFDRAMATLAAVPPEAVLLSRVRKRVAGMKSPPSKIGSTGQP
jgi:hypothetical protein